MVGCVGWGRSEIVFAGWNTWMVGKGNLSHTSHVDRPCCYTLAIVATSVLMPQNFCSDLAYVLYRYSLCDKCFVKAL